MMREGHVYGVIEGTTKAFGDTGKGLEGRAARGMGGSGLERVEGL